MAFKLNWSTDLQKIADDASKRALAETYKLLNQEFQRAITAKKWSWPLSPSPRDIVDTGSLRQSNSYTISGSKVTFKWGKDYASFAHNGGIQGRKNYAARPWTEAVLYGEYGFKKFETAKTYKDLWVRYFKEKS